MIRAVLLALLLLAPLAGAEHAFSHRVVVEGRVVDARGLPVPGVRPLVVASWPDARPCDEREQDVTNATGDYRVCRHAHELARAEVTVSHAGAAETVAVDPVTRKAVAHLALAGEADARDVEGERRFARTLRVEGRVFSLHEARVVDGVEVNATPREGAPVAVRLVRGASVVANASAATDAFGDYAVELAVVELAPGMRVEVESELKTVSAEADARLRRVDLDMVRDLRRIDTTDAPGAAPPPVPGPGLALVVALVALTAWARRPRGGAG